MSDSDTSAFGKFVPGYDFLQNLAKGASSNIPQMPNLGNWVAPTLNVEELDKRIEELKGVHFWLEQNSRALGATIQALEVQKMTMETLKGMNFTMGMPAAAQAAAAKPAAAPAAPPPAPDPEAAASKVVDPVQLWGALTQQFQQIASTALQDVAKHSAAAASSTKAAGKSGATKARGATAKTPRKAAGKSVSAKSTAKARRSVR